MRVLSLPVWRTPWISKPIARNKFLSRSADDTACTYIWDCTAGKFNWHYEVDETVYVLEGRVVINDPTGNSRTLKPATRSSFREAQKAEWTVDCYVRKVAFLRTPLPWQVLMAKRFYHALKRLMGSRRNKTEKMVPSLS